MYPKRTFAGVAAAAFVLTLAVSGLLISQEPPGEAPPAEVDPTDSTVTVSTPEPREIPDSVKRGLAWLAEAQQEDGGWGAGSHASQQVRDPHAVSTDPATTAFVAGAFLRSGHTPTAGDYKDNVRRATEYVCKAIEDTADDDSPRITELTGTQPQTKLGPLVDTSLAAQYLARVLPRIPEESPLHERVDNALGNCVRRIQLSMKEDGSWNVGGGWAPVLQSSLACQSLELARAVGCPINTSGLDRARDYQKGNFDEASGAVTADAAAGIPLYALSSSQRANAAEARAAMELVDAARETGQLSEDAEVDESSLQAIGVGQARARKLAAANFAIQAQNAAINDDGVLAGFGNNGGEEFLSYLFTSESMIIQGGDVWESWNEKMHTRLAKIQSPDGSWSGHHCITSPVFCTAAVVSCLTTDRDAEILIQIARDAAKVPGETPEDAETGS